MNVENKMDEIKKARECRSGNKIRRKTLELVMLIRFILKRCKVQLRLYTRFT